MKIIVVGLGSMGRRRIRLLKQLDKTIEVYGIDSKDERRKQADNELNIESYSSLEEALDEIHPECAIVSTSPLSHADIIEKCLEHGCHVFTELNLVDEKYSSNIELSRSKGQVLFLSSTFLYRDEIKYINNRVKDSGKVNYIYHVGQYLPDWHPWESIKDYFVGDKRTNGCRELLAIELPWLTKVFGEIESYTVLSDKNTELPIQYDDNYLIQFKHTNGAKGTLAVDVISRKAVRNLEIYGENIYLTWDGTPTGLKEYDCTEKKESTVSLYSSVDKLDGYASFIIENAYLNELKTFLGMVNGEAKAEYTFEDDQKVLELIDKIEARRN